MKTLTLFLCLICSPTFAQQSWWNAVAAQQAPVAAGGGGSCAVWLAQDLESDEYNSDAGILSQSVTITAGNGTCCGFNAMLAALVDQAAVKIEIRDASNGGGTLLGTSATIAISSASGWAMRSFTFSPAVTLTPGNVYYFTVAGYSNTMYWKRYNTSDVYAGGSAYTGTTAGFYDFHFEVLSQ